MSARTRTAALALAAASALVLGGAAAPAFAGDPLDGCTAVDDYTTAYTGSVWWYSVCTNTTTMSEAATTNKSDAFDGVGNLVAVGLSDVPILAPASATTVTRTATSLSSSFVDVGVDLGGGDIVDIAVDFELAGSYARWTVSTVETGTSTPASLDLEWRGDLGSDTESVFDISGAQMLSHGDDFDPPMLWDVDADALNYDVTNGNSGVYIEASGEVVTITLALVDYGCPGDDIEAAADAYALTLLPTFATTFGAELQLPGTVDCITATPLTVAPGAAIDHTIAATYVGSDFIGGGTGDYYIPDFRVDDLIDVAILDTDTTGAPPSFVVTGTAPTEPGVYWVALGVGSEDVDDWMQGHWALIVEEPAGPQLAATGSSTPWTFAIGALLALVAGAGVLVSRSRARA